MTTPLLPTTEWVFLAGRPPMAEYLGFMSTQMLEGGTAGQQQLADEWRAANDRVKDLTETEAGLADGAEVDPLPEELLPLAEDVLGEPAYMQSFAVVPTELRIVDLNRLVVFQKNINMDYVRELQESLPTDPTIEQVFGFCMAPEGARPPVRSQQVANNAFVFISPSTDFRFLGADLIPHDQAPTAGATGHPTSVVALPVGYGSNYLNVVSVNGRLVLNNGSHRAYALRDAGFGESARCDPKDHPAGGAGSHRPEGGPCQPRPISPASQAAPSEGLLRPGTEKGHPRPKTGPPSQDHFQRGIA
jgi:hypothetical protein